MDALPNDSASEPIPESASSAAEMSSTSRLFPSPTDRAGSGAELGVVVGMVGH